MRTLFRLLMAMALLLCFSSVALAQDRLSAEEMAKVTGVLVPSPSELFVAVDSMGDYDWSSVVRVNTNTDYQGDILRALNLGVRSADGFLAVQAEDGKQTGEVVRTIEKLARALAVDDPILAKGNEIQKLVMEKKWAKVRSQLDVLKTEVENYIAGLGDEQNAVMASAGGWLEGLRAVSKLLNDQYSEKASSILHQPSLVQHFQEKFKGLSPEAKKLPVIQLIDSKLPEIAALIQGEPGKPIAKDAVSKLNAISTEIIEAIERG